MFLLFLSDNGRSTISANAVSVLLLKPVDIFLFLRYWYTDSLSLTTLAKPGRLGLCVGFPESFEASNLKISFCTAQTLQNSKEFGNIQRNRYDDTKMSNRNSHQCFRIANSSDGRRYTSDFTTINARKWRIFHI